MKNQLIKGTFILSSVGILTRIIGFYYRIFLSNTIGATGMGLYQMIFPMYGLCVSFAVTGIQMAVSKFVAAKKVQNDYKGMLYYLRSGLIISLYLSIFISLILFLFSGYIATDIVGDARCSSLLKLAAFAIPFCAAHGCIIGYFLGKSETVVPALALFFEQISRVGIVYIISIITLNNTFLSPNVAMAGLILGEAVSTLVCVIALVAEIIKFKNQHKLSIPDTFIPCNYKKDILKLSYPIATSRVLTSLILSSEAVLILQGLKQYGMSHDASISIYGVLTGMAMPFIFFPSTITGAISSMILPSISESESEGNYIKISQTTATVVKYCFSIGIFFAALFFVYGHDIGIVIFHNQDCGTFIALLSWLCPFMYLGSTLASILNGLGLTKITFVVNVSVSLSRVLSILILVPIFGIKGYLWGLLFSQIISALFFLYFVKKHTHFKYSIRDCITKPFFITAICILTSIIFQYILTLFITIPFLILCLSILLPCILFVFLLL